LLNDFLQCLLGKLDLGLVFVESGVLQFTRNKMSFGNLDLLFGDVSRHFDQLHTVEERPRNVVQVVGRGNEQRFGEVVVHVEEVVVERGVLLGVEHFEQCRRGVSVDGVLRYLIYLVENEYRI